MRKNILVMGIFSMVTLSFFNSCRYENIEDNINKLPVPTKCDTLKSSYTKDIANIVALKCTKSCHIPSGLGSFLLLNDFEKVKEGVKSGNVIESIMHGINVSPMPKNSPKLSIQEIDKFLCWKDRGYPEN